MLLLTCLSACSGARAQFNDSVHYYTAFVGSGSVNRTNSSSAYLLNNTLKGSINFKRIQLNSTNIWVYGQQNKVLTNNDFTATLDGNLYTGTSPVYYWILGNYTTNYSLRINSQWQGGAGAACRIFDKPSLMLNISDGILYESSDIFTPDGPREQYATFRNSFRLMLRWSYKDKVKFSSTSFIQHSLEDTRDYIARSNNSLSVFLNKWLALNTSLQYQKVTRTGKESLLFTYGLTAERYF